MPSPILFREALVGEGGPSWATPGVVRAREVIASPRDLQVTDVPVGFRVDRRRDVTLNLFDDAWFPVRLEAVERDRIGSTVWYGRVAGEPRSSVTLTVNEGSMSVSLSSGSRRYMVRQRQSKSTGSDVHVDGI